MNYILEKTSCELKTVFKIILVLVLIVILLFSIPIVPFLFISYHSFYGKFGIIPLIKNFNKKI